MGTAGCLHEHGQHLCYGRKPQMVGNGIGYDPSDSIWASLGDIQHAGLPGNILGGQNTGIEEVNTGLTAKQRL
jgi:hypothetical protein